MNLYLKAEKKLKEKYNIDLLEEIVLARNDRAVYYVEYHENSIVFNKIHGKSPMDLLANSSQFTMSEVENMFCNTSKYGEVAGKEFYKKKNLDTIKLMKEEANVTIPLTINHQLFWVRFHLYKTKKDEERNIFIASCYITDVTKYLVNEEALYEKTHKDELTGLFNRYTLYYHFELHGSRAPMAGFYFDIDDFKMYNDTYGHDIGDEVLVQFSKQLLALTDDTFSAYRLGGDEFFCLILDSTIDKAKEYVESIQQSIQSIVVPKVNHKLTLSIGVVLTNDDITHKREAFVKEADRLMYVSKKKGKNTVTFGEFVVFV